MLLFKRLYKILPVLYRLSFVDNLTSQPFFNDVLQTKEHSVCKFASAALKVRVHGCRVGRVLKMVCDLREKKFTLI